MQAAKISNNFQLSFDDLVRGVSKLNSFEMDAFFEQLNKVLGSQKPLPNLTEEAILLKKIKALIPTSVVRRFKELQIKRNNDTISEKEQEEILFITDFIEEKSAERVTLLAALAKIRQISLQELVKQIPLKDFHA